MSGRVISGRKDSSHFQFFNENGSDSNSPVERVNFLESVLAVLVKDSK